MKENTQADATASPPTNGTTRKRGGTPLRQLDVEKMIKLYQGEEGKRPLTLKAIAARFGVSDGTVRSRMKAAGVPPRKPAISDPATLSISEMRRLYEKEKWAYVRIGRAAGISATTVRLRLEAAGVTIKKPGPSPAVLAEARRLYVDEELTQMEVAARMGVGRTPVVAYLKAAGVKSRPKGSQPHAKR